MRYMRTQSMRTHDSYLRFRYERLFLISATLRTIFAFDWTLITTNCPQIIQNIFWEINGKFMEINVKNSEHAPS